jgi:hypothetical protein
MKHNVVRSVLTILLAGVAVFDIAQGILVLTGVCAPPVNYQGTPFTDATVPMLLVAIVVGGSSLLAAATVFSRHRWSVFLAAAAGLIVVAWELMVVGQFSSIFVYIGLAVMALAEYLWTTEFSGQQLPPRKHEVIRIALLAIAAFIATSAIEGGVAVLGGVVFGYKLPLSWLAGTPFSDYTIPGLALAVVVGGSALLAAATVFIHREWAVFVSVVAGLMMTGYLVVEIVSIDSKLGDALPTALAVQLFYSVLGVALIGLGGFLWMREYRTQHFHLGLPSGELLLDGPPDHHPHQLRRVGAGRHPVHELAVPQDGHPIPDLGHLLQVVRDEDDARPILLQATDDLEQALDLLPREGGGRLVHDQDPGVQAERLRYLDHLPLRNAQSRYQNVRVHANLYPLQ